MVRRFAAFALLAALALAGSAAYGMVGGDREACRMGRACPMKTAHGGGRCPAPASWSVELGCCAPVPAVPAAPAPTADRPLAGGADAAPAVLTAAARCLGPALFVDSTRERARAARLHDLGLFTLLSVLLI